MGIFNVVSAIFVDSIVSSEAKEEGAKTWERLDDKDLWSSCIVIILRGILRHPESGFSLDSSSLSAIADDISELDIERHVIEDVVREERDVVKCLNKLDINPADQRKISKILDHNHSGKVKVMDIIHGLHRLRGSFRRSDIISVDLVLEGVQEKLEKVLGLVEEMELGARKNKTQLDTEPPFILDGSPGFLASRAILEDDSEGTEAWSTLEANAKTIHSEL